MAIRNETLFQKYDRRAAEASIPRNTAAAIDWFRNVIRKDKAVSFDRVSDGARKIESKRVTFAPGNMFMYTYDPKYKDVLPFYDTYPLIIVVEKTDTGWYGINVHYLPPILRAELFKDILYFKKNPKAIADVLAKHPLTTPCLKQYLVKHVRSRPIPIPKEEWEIAIQLPFEGFQKSTNTQVWANSRYRVAKKRR